MAVVGGVSTAFNVVEVEVSGQRAGIFRGAAAATSVEHYRNIN